jgi:hypothetical protein
LYLKKLFVCRKIHKYRQKACIEGKWTWQGAVAHSATSTDATWCRLMAPPPCHIIDPRESLHTASPALIQVGLIQRWRLSCLGLLGPPSHTWRGQTDLQTAFLTKATAIGACNRHPATIHHRWMAKRCKGRSIDTPCLSTASFTTTSTPCPLRTIKGAVELSGDHHSSIQIIPSSPRSSQE